MPRLKDQHLVYALMACLSLFSGPPAMAAAPLCSSVLLNINLDKALDNIAQMRLNLDLARTSGLNSTSLEIKSLEEKYPEKYQELVHYHGSEKHLKTMIKERIALLQAREKKEAIKEQGIKENQENKIKLPSYVPFQIGPRFTAFEYFPGTDSVLLQSKTRVVAIHNLKNRTTIYPLEQARDVQAHYPSIGSNLVFITEKEVLTYDLSANQILTRKKLQEEISPNWSKISPSGETIGISRFSEFILVDVLTGHIKKYSWPELGFTDPESTPQTFHFVNNSEIAFINFGTQFGSTLFNFKTQLIKELHQQYEGPAADLARFPNGALRLIRNFTNQQEGSVDIVDSRDLRVTSRHSLPMGPRHFSRAGFRVEGSEVQVIDYLNLEAGWRTIQNFPDRNTLKMDDIINAAVTDDIVTILVRQNDVNFIQQWTLD